MNLKNHLRTCLRAAIANIAILALSSCLSAKSSDPMIDDFSDNHSNNLGHARLIVSDTSVGGKTIAEQTVENGLLSFKGEISPPRGQPGWASAILILSPEGDNFDASGFEGVFVRVRIKKGKLSLSANSTEISNFDYHASTVTRTYDDKFQELKIPFSSMKRTWSKQTPLNPSTLASISLVAFGMQKEAFEFEFDELRFY